MDVVPAPIPLSYGCWRVSFKLAVFVLPQKPLDLSGVVTFSLGQDIITPRFVCILMFMHLGRMGNSSGKGLSFAIALCFNLLGLLECIGFVVEYRHFSDIHFFFG